MMYGLTEEQMEAMELKLAGNGYAPDLSIRHLRWCLNCECSQKAYINDPCWQCGGETVYAKPEWWPTMSGSQGPDYSQEESE